MIVEDEGLVADDLQSILVDDGFEVVGIADSFDSAQSLAEAEAPDLALLDIRLKGERDGIDVAGELRRRNIGFVYLTSHADPGTLARAEVTEPLGYVLKPFGSREMKPVLQTAMYRHAAELRLKELESWLSTTLASIGDGVIVADINSKVTFMNPVAEELVGVSLDKALGRPLAEVLYVVDTSRGVRVPCLAQRAMEFGETVFLPADAELIRADRSRVPVEDSGAPIRDRDHRISGAVIVLRDASERRRAEQSRLEAERRMQDVERAESVAIVAGGLAHDLNNVLTSIIGNVQLCREDAGFVDEAPLEEIESQARTAAELCDRILAGGAAAPLGVEHVNVSELVRRCIRTERMLASERVELSHRLERDDLLLVGDRLQMLQVLQNLLRNAVEAIGDGEGSVMVCAGSITLPTTLLNERASARLLPPGNYVWLEVSDDGPGIPEDVRAQLFVPFHSTKSKGGRGIGLASVSGIVRRHCGAIDVDSQLGQGTVFRILVPAPSDGEARHRREGDAPRGCVMLVDDDAPVRQVSSKLIERRGWQCVAVAGGADALEHARSGAQFDVAVVDCRLGDMKVEDLIDELRQLRPALPVLLTSGFYDVDPRLLEGGRTDFLGKPFRVEELDRRLSRLVADR